MVILQRRGKERFPLTSIIAGEISSPLGVLIEILSFPLVPLMYPPPSLPHSYSAFRLHALTLYFNSNTTSQQQQQPQQQQQDQRDVVRVYQRHFLLAREKLTPSVSEEEMKYYRRVQAQFTQQK